MRSVLIGVLLMAAAPALGVAGVAAGRVPPPSAVAQPGAPSPVSAAQVDHIQTLAPGTRYDPRIPALKSVTGHDFGEEISAPDDIHFYLSALNASAPDRTVLIEYARSWEGRPLHALVIASPERIARLEQVKADLRQLGDPRGLGAPDARPARGQHARRGGAAPRRARQRGLVGRRGDGGGVPPARRAGGSGRRPHPARRHRDHRPGAEPRWAGALRLSTNAHGPGGEPDAEPLAAEHDEPWPGGRSNHYLFDLNRDWFAQTHPESRARCSCCSSGCRTSWSTCTRWAATRPYYFPPAAPPGNTCMTDAAAAVARDLRARQRGALRRARVPVLHPRGLRLVLSRLRRLVALRAGRASA